MYEKEFIARVKDLAVLGLYPSQIAERLELVGEFRRRFLEDIVNIEHPLHKEYVYSRQHHMDDLDAALNTSAFTGDPKALRLNYELNRQNRLDLLKQKLFGI